MRSHSVFARLRCDAELFIVCPSVLCCGTLLSLACQHCVAGYIKFLCQWSSRHERQSCFVSGDGVGSGEFPASRLLPAGHMGPSPVAFLLLLG